MIERPIVGVSVTVFRDEQATEVLLVQRGRGSALGHWAPPGGKLELGETVAEGAAREVLEETGLSITVPEHGTFATVDIIEKNEDGSLLHHFVLIEVVAQLAGDAEPSAADDAADCRWWPVARLAEAQPQVDQLARVVALAQRWVREGWAFAEMS
ncbi:MAG: NUDIX domain-containing protein [Ardenticatenales bacterium]|nr:NUDIX domain-containing protein [Ardenticatenales bacterium]